MLAALSSCAGEDTTIDRVHDACAPLAVHVDSPNVAQASGLAGAFTLWRDHGAPLLGTTGEATIELAFRPAAGAFRGVYDDETGVIYINDGLTDPDVLAIVIAHELGHAFGLPHVAGHDSVMIKGNLTFVPTDADATSLAALWGTCPATSSSAPPGS